MPKSSGSCPVVTVSRSAPLRQAMSADASLASLLKLSTGMDDVTDLLEVLGALEDADVTMYLQAFVPDAAKADEVAAKVVAGRAAEKQAAAAATSTEAATAAAPSAEVAPAGTTAYRKSDAAEEFLFGGKGKAAKAKEGPAREGPPVVGGAAAVPSQRKSSKKQQQVVTAKGLDSLGRALKPGRHLCDCNARRHDLLYNCLSCGKVICAQEGPGPCLFCGNDPDTENGHAVADAATAASAQLAAERKERLLEFDRTAAKRTTVIDDQADYFLHASDDAWLSRDEQRAAAEKAQQREDETARQRRELRLTLDFENHKVVRERPGGAAEPPRAVEEEPTPTAAAATSVPGPPLPTVAARQQPAAAAAASASNGPGGARAGRSRRCRRRRCTAAREPDQPDGGRSAHVQAERRGRRRLGVGRCCAEAEAVGQGCRGGSRAGAAPLGVQGPA